jgi:hypothetical protein
METGIHGGGKLGIFEVDREGRWVLESYLDGPGSDSFWEENSAVGPALGIPGTGIGLLFENAGGPNGSSNNVSFTGEALGLDVALQAGGGQFALGGGGAVPLFGASIHGYIVIATGETKRFILSQGYFDKLGGETKLIERHGPQGGRIVEPIKRFPSVRSATMCSSGYATLVQREWYAIRMGWIEVLP